MRRLLTAFTAAVLVFPACASVRSPDTADMATSAPSIPTGFPARCAPDEVEVLLVGTFHFAGSTTDAVSTPLDVRTPARQAELEDLTGRLARWAPEQIAVEWPSSFADSTDARYARYVAGGGQTASQNEVVQLGFRLARRLGHATVHPIDHQMPIGNDSIGPLLARRPDLRARGDSMMAELEARERAVRQASEQQTLVERLAEMNTEDALHGGNSGAMFLWLEAGDGENRAGPQMLARWYERNFHMAHNLTRIMHPGVRRLLVLVGAGHVPPLRNILDESPRFCPVSPLPLLR